MDTPRIRVIVKVIVACRVAHPSSLAELNALRSHAGDIAGPEQWQDVVGIACRHDHKPRNSSALQIKRLADQDRRGSKDLRIK